jgi:hypothetical protein
MAKLYGIKGFQASSIGVIGSTVEAASQIESREKKPQYKKSNSYGPYPTALHGTNLPEDRLTA